MTDEAQRGFKAGIEGCEYQNTIRRATRFDRDLPIAWIDLHKAFESVNNLKMVEVLSLLWSKITRVIVLMY